MTRYFYFFGLLAAIFMTVVLGQDILQAAHAPFLLTDNHGVGQVLLYLVVLVWIGLFCLRTRHQITLPPLTLYGSERQKARRGFWALGLVTLSGVLLSYVAMAASGHLVWTEVLQNGLPPGRWVAVAVALVVVVVLTTTEEIIFRWFLLNFLWARQRTRRAQIAAIVTESLVFTLVHHFRDPLVWLRWESAGLFIGLFLLGIVLSLTYWLTGSLACAIGLHSALLWPEVFRSQSGLLELRQGGWWMGNHDDIRTSPLAWLLFLMLLGVVVLLREPLSRRYRIEA